MLQSGRYFDLALRPLGFSLQEVHGLSAEEVLAQEPGFMVGLKTGQGGRHARVLLERRNGSLVFLNPHREGDGEPDLVILTAEECLQRLEESSTVGRLISCPAKETDFRPLLAEARVNWRTYQEELTAFISQPHPSGDILAERDRLFRALLLDGPEGARLCGFREQEARLRAIQGQFLGALRGEKPVCLLEYMDMDTLEAAFAFYMTGPVSANDMGKFS